MFQKGISEWKIVIGGSPILFDAVLKETLSYTSDGTIDVTIETSDTVPIAQAVKVLREPDPKIEVYRKRYMFTENAEKLFMYERYKTDRINMTFAAEGVAYAGECTLHFISDTKNGAVETSMKPFD